MNTDAMIREREAELREAHARSDAMVTESYAQLREAHARSDAMVIGSQFEPTNLYKIMKLK